MSRKTDLAVLADSPAMLHGTVTSCGEALLRRRDEFSGNYFHFGGDPTSGAAVIAPLAGA